jgi:hypothetical protein
MDDSIGVSAIGAWPSKYALSFDGSTATLRAGGKPDDDVPDLRALSLYEAVGHASKRLDRVRVELVGDWRGKRLARLLRRAGLFGRLLPALRLEVFVEGEHVPTPDPLGGMLATLDRTPTDFIVERRDGIELLSRGLDAWIDATAAVLDALVDENHREVTEAPAVRKLILCPKTGKGIHPRIPWIVEQLVAAGLPVEAPSRPVSAAGSSFVDDLIAAGVAHKAKLGIVESGKYKRRDYAHILPQKIEQLAVWAPLRGTLKERMPVRHPMFGNFKSSQAFAVNVLGGLEHVELLGEAIARQEGLIDFAPVEMPRLAYEYAPKPMQQALGEDGAHQTQIDAVLWLAGQGGRRRALTIEVKLIETAFGHCRGPRAKENANVDVCGGTPADRLARCFLRTGEHHRTYLTHAEASFPALTRLLTDADGACPLRAGGYQLARNLVATAWLRGALAGAPPPPENDRVPDATFCVLSASATPALYSPPLRPLGAGAAARLAALGVRWIDAAKLVGSVAMEPGARELVEYLRERYPPVFAQG